MRTGVAEDFSKTDGLSKVKNTENVYQHERVRVGDVILSVNNEYDPSKFLHILSTKSRLELVFKRLEDPEVHVFNTDLSSIAKNAAALKAREDMLKK